MSARPGRLPAESFFLAAVPGKRFCIYHAPHPDRVCRGAFIYVHPFADEMNLSRQMVALQARAFADMGYGVLLIDLFGCGDSTGEFGDARWEIWKEDLAVAKKWLEDRLSTRIGLWGLRLGALLALDFARSVQRRMAPLILWQPVISGKSFLTQFLRLRVASDMLADGQGAIGTQALRNAMRAGEILEIAGYDIAPALASAIDALDAEALWVNTTPVHWFDIVRAVESAMPPATTEVISEWRRQRVDLRLHTVRGLPFWAMQELSECPELLAMTTALLDDSSGLPV
jgi:exosortase A-associated hydrolase 2